MKIRIIKCVDCGELGLCVGFQRITEHDCSGEYYDVLEAEYDGASCIEPQYRAQTRLLIITIDRLSVIYYSDFDWEYKRDRIFNISKSTIQPLLDDLGIDLNYYDCHTDYEQQVTAYYDAVMKIKKNLEAEGY